MHIFILNFNALKLFHIYPIILVVDTAAQRPAVVLSWYYQYTICLNANHNTFPVDIEQYLLK